MPVHPQSLKKSAFLRLVAITLAATVIFFILGFSINAVGISNVRDDLRNALRVNTSYVTEEMTRDFDTLYFFMKETAADRQLTRFALSGGVLPENDRMNCIHAMSAQESMIKRSSPLVEQVQIMLPAVEHTIVTERLVYQPLDREAWDSLFPAAEKNSVTPVEWNGRLWLLLARYDQDTPLFMVVISILPEALIQRLASMSNRHVDGAVLLRQDGTVFAAAGNGLESMASTDRDVFSSRQTERLTGLTLCTYDRFDPTMTAFVHHRIALWFFTLVVLGILALYLLYYWRFILRPLNAMLDSLRQSERDGRVRFIQAKGTDYDDIYARFNDMLGHIEELAGQVYEEQYLRQQAELKQLQMQIDPHFLYNSLYLIYRMARAQGSEDIAALSLHLSNYYRYITKMPEQVVPLRDEISHVMNYLEIQRVRFEPRVHIEAEPLPEEIAGERIPSLLIQPLVENAFQHGVKDVTGGGIVSLRYRVTPETFQVIVADNSGIMDEARVDSLRRQLQREDADGANALGNLYRRLRLYQNGENSLELKSVNNGLTAILTFRRKGRADENAADCG